MQQVECRTGSKRSLGGLFNISIVLESSSSPNSSTVVCQVMYDRESGLESKSELQCRSFRSARLRADKHRKIQKRSQRFCFESIRVYVVVDGSVNAVGPCCHIQMTR